MGTGVLREWTRRCPASDRFWGGTSERPSGWGSGLTSGGPGGLLMLTHVAWLSTRRGASGTGPILRRRLRLRSRGSCGSCAPGLPCGAATCWRWTRERACRTPRCSSGWSRFGCFTISSSRRASATPIRSAVHIYPRTAVRRRLRFAASGAGDGQAAVDPGGTGVAAAAKGLRVVERFAVRR
jgi:hypothetical protein